jgi:hypothetical protein
VVAVSIAVVTLFSVTASARNSFTICPREKIMTRSDRPATSAASEETTMIAVPWRAASRSTL